MLKCLDANLRKEVLVHPVPQFHLSIDLIFFVLINICRKLFQFAVLTLPSAEIIINGVRNVGNTLPTMVPTALISFWAPCNIAVTFCWSFLLRKCSHLCSFLLNSSKPSALYIEFPVFFIKPLKVLDELLDFLFVVLNQFYSSAHLSAHLYASLFPPLLYITLSFSRAANTNKQFIN